MKKINKFALTIFTWLNIFFTSCTLNFKVDDNLQKQYGADYYYFIGLKEVQKNNKKNALRYFNHAISKGSTYVKRRSYEQKIKLGNIQKQIEEAKKYLSIYSDEAALIFANQIFFENKEYSLVINSTNKIDLSKCPNKLASMRLTSMMEKHHSNLQSEIATWFTTRKISQEHFDFYNTFIHDKISINELNSINLINPVNPDKSQMMKLNDYHKEIYSLLIPHIIEFRIQCYNRNYSIASNYLDTINEYCVVQKIFPLTSDLVSDLGRTYLAISSKHLKNSNYFFEISQTHNKADEKLKFNSLFYAARILDHSGSYISKAKEHYINAMKNSPSPEDYDLALWYLLNLSLKVSIEDCINTLEKYCPTWNNPYYFSNILDNLSFLLFTSGKFNYFSKIYKTINGHADNVSTSRFAYLTGRLISLNFAKGTEEEKIEAFKTAFYLNGGTDIYYRLLSAKELNLSIEEIEKNIFNPTTALPAKNNADAEILLQGYADFGFVDLIYPEWQYFYTQNPDIFSIETICKVSEFLKSCGNSFNNNYYKSLRMTSKTGNLDNSKINRKVFELSYPRNFLKEISLASKEFDVEEYDMLGLIRTESFFNPIVESSKGAMGLSQLMYTTFEECATKLKLENPNITDPATNVRLGTFYYSNLVKRLNNSDILALFAYNAGPTKVRRWLKTSKVGLGLYKNLPSDLFLETIPISETRNYGRKVIQSAALYAWLYYEKNPCDIVNEMM